MRHRTRASPPKFPPPRFNDAMGSFHQLSRHVSPESLDRHRSTHARTLPPERTAAELPTRELVVRSGWGGGPPPPPPPPPRARTGGGFAIPAKPGPGPDWPRRGGGGGCPGPGGGVGRRRMPYLSPNGVWLASSWTCPGAGACPPRLPLVPAFPSFLSRTPTPPSKLCEAKRQQQQRDRLFDFLTLLPVAMRQVQLLFTPPLWHLPPRENLKKKN